MSDRGGSSTRAIEVLDTGLLLTVQDAGRPGFQHLGVPRSGAADGRSLAAANRLVGNAPEAAALEATLLGPRLRAVREVEVAIAGADFGPVEGHGGGPIDVSRPVHLEAGAEIGFVEAGDPERGCRVYIAVAGGIDVPLVLGSRSTSLVGAFGGLDGRPLRAGDILAAFETGNSPPPQVIPPDPAISLPSPDRPVWISPGPAASEPGGDERLSALVDAPWTVGLDSDRRGLRLERLGDGGVDLAAPGGDRPSQGTVIGAIQLTPSGQPLVLLPDGGTTGGYPVIAIVASEDLHVLGQLTPGAAIRFARASVRFSE